jgi:predicted GNAT family acetyltransferase
VADAIAETGETPMLHVADDNPNARAVYEQLGFVTVRMCGFSALGVPR